MLDDRSSTGIRYSPYVRTLLVGIAAALLGCAGRAQADERIDSPRSSSASGLVGLWHLDGNATDSSGHGNNGTINGATVIADGISGQAFRFNGSASIDVGNLSFPNAAYTVNIWLRTTQPAATEDWRVPINKADSPPGGNQTFEIYLGDGRAADVGGLNAPAYLVWLGGVSVVSNHVASNTNINARDGQWHMATATYHSGAQALYIDGCLATSSSYTGALPLTSNSILIGGRNNFGPFHHPWIGDLDEVAIYDRAQAPSEVQALYRLYRPSAGCGQASDLKLSKVICYDLTTTLNVIARITGPNWNCAGLTTSAHDRLKIAVLGTTK